MRLFGIALISTILSAQTWQSVSTAVNNGDEPALARDSSGNLHVVLRVQKKPNTSYSYGVLDRAGAIQTPLAETAIQNWGSLSTPALFALPDGALHLYFGGVLGGADTKNVWNQGALLIARKGANEAAFKVDPDVKSGNRRAYLGPVGAVRAKDGAVWAGWPANAEYILQKPGAPSQNVAEANACCTYHGQLATDAESGAIYAAWFSNGRNNEGTFVRQLSPETGKAVLVPNSATQSDGKMVGRDPNNLVAITGRDKGEGVFVALCAGYPQCAAVELWKIGTSAGMKVAEGRSFRIAAISKGPEGRLWVAWMNDRSTPMFARSNRAVTRFSAPAALPTVNDFVHRLTVEGSHGGLDVFATTGSAVSVTRALVGLDVSATPARVPVTGGSVTVKVSDVGDPVEGVAVEAAGIKGVTGADGSVTLNLPAGRPGAVKVSGSKEFYRDGSASVQMFVPAPGKK